jgi:hypothetical protein
MPKPDLKKLYENIVTYSERMFKNMDKFNRQDYARALKQVKAVVADAYAKYGAQGKLTYAEMQKYERIKKLDQMINKAIDDNVGNVAVRSRKTLKETTTGSYEKSVAIIALITGVTIAHSLTSDEINTILQKPITGLTLNKKMDLRVTDLKIRITSEVKRQILREAPIEDVWKGVKGQFEKVYAKDRVMLGDDNHRVAQEAIRESLKSGKLTGDLEPTLTWTTMFDDRVRDSHVRMNGQTVGVNEYFMFTYGPNTGQFTAGPGQSGFPEEDSGCRCWLVAGFRERKDGE